MTLSRAHVTWVVALALALVPACGSGDRVSIGDDCEAGFCGREAGPTFTAPPAADGGDASNAPRPPVAMCVGTECPAPYATCGSTATFQCGTNLQNDPDNCGACGASCAGFDAINLGSRCVKGACAFECLIKHDEIGASHEFRDCNGLLDDGCEIDISADPSNCGACGNECQAGQHCIFGKCGCTNGKTDCNGHCTDTRFDDNNCGGCGNRCAYSPPSACTPARPNTYYGCVQNACDKLKCKNGFSDCNHDLNLGCASDGCETNVKSSTDNCGGCGIKCGVGQECRDEGNGPQCLDPCAKAGLTQCSRCSDLLSDKANCGACGIFCPPPRANQISSCKKGFCVVECVPGFADCNGDPSDGCEVDVKVHPANCGACGHRCDFGVGQPCVEGKCLMVECDAGATK